MGFNLSEEELQLFLEETAEQIQILEEGFLQMEKEGAGQDVLAAVFRAAHTVKGSSAAIGHQRMTALTHAMENLLDLMRKGELGVSRAAMDALFRGLDALRGLQAAMAGGAESGEDLAPVLDELRRAASKESADGAGAAGRGGAEPAGLSLEALERLRGGAEEGLVPLRIDVRLAPDSIMPAVRALQVHQALAQEGEVVASRPTLEEIEAEQVGQSLTLFVLTRSARETLRNAVAAVSDVTAVDIARVDTGRAAAGGEASEAPATAGEGAAAEAATGGAAAAGGSARVAAAGGPHGKDTGGSGGGGAAGGRAAAESRTVRVDVAVLDTLMNLVGELVIDRTRLSRLAADMSEIRGMEELAAEVGRISNHLVRITGFLQDEIMKARMLPIERVFKKFPRMVRDLARQLHKEVDFVVRGENTELDRSIIEFIGDPLIHLLRNSIDHGLEPPDERERAGKPRTGTVVLAADHRDNQIVVEVSDDGRGIDPNRVREAAVRKGIVTPEQARELADREAQMLIFAPGFSTAREVSDISGRGVGLDVVVKNIERLNGRVEVESEPGKGTAFRIYLPLTLATIRALLVRVAGQTFALPLASVVETLRIGPQEVQTVKRREVIVVRGKVVPVHRLDRCLGLGRRRGGAGAQGSPKRLYAVLVTADGSEMGLVVDALVGEQEIVIKSLGRFIGDIRGLAGATVLGDGRLALILDARGLKEVFSEQGAAVQAAV